MTDLLHVLPDFDTLPYAPLLDLLDTAHITTSDLVALPSADIAARAKLGPADSTASAQLTQLTDAVVAALHRHLDLAAHHVSAPRPALRPLQYISTLDAALDAALGNGFPRGYLVEIAGESGAGKTQLLLTLLLAAQLPPPHGLAQSAIYISSEASLATTRLAQLISSHPVLSALPPHQKPSLQRILSIQVRDLEAQEHIMRYMLPVAIEKHRVGLVVLDSVAANYRTEFEKKDRRDGASMARRGAKLAQLGALFREIARTHDVAIVVANQVADRFTKSNLPSPSPTPRTTSGRSQGAEQTSISQNSLGRPPSDPPSQPEDEIILSPDPLTLDHQQRWFTGWGDIRSDPPSSHKTPSLGLVWSNQLACRIALVKKPVFASRPPLISVNGEDRWNDEESHISRWRRWFKVVFAPWAPPSDGRGVEFEVLINGITHVPIKNGGDQET